MVVEKTDTRKGGWFRFVPLPLAGLKPHAPSAELVCWREVMMIEQTSIPADSNATPPENRLPGP
jgi:hypothetical protein